MRRTGAAASSTSIVAALLSARPNCSATGNCMISIISAYQEEHHRYYLPSLSLQKRVCVHMIRCLKALRRPSGNHSVLRASSTEPHMSMAKSIVHGQRAATEPSASHRTEEAALPVHTAAHMPPARAMLDPLAKAVCTDISPIVGPSTRKCLSG